MSDNPHTPGAKKLGEVADLYRVRSGNYRIEDARSVVVVNAGDRRDIYRAL